MNENVLSAVVELPPRETDSPSPVPPSATEQPHVLPTTPTSPLSPASDAPLKSSSFSPSTTSPEKFEALEVEEKRKKPKADHFQKRKLIYRIVKTILLCDNRLTQKLESLSSKTPFGLDFVLISGVIGFIWFLGGILLGVLYTNEKPATKALSPFETSVVKNLHVAPTCLSIIGSLIVISTFFIFKGFKKFNIRLIFYLKISDLLLDSSFLLVYVWPGFCVVQASFSEFCPLSSVLFTSFIAFVLYENLVKRRPMRELQKLEIPFLIIGYGIPLIFAILVLAIPGMGAAQLSWCWISNKYKSWRFLFFYLLLFIIFIYNMIMYAIIMRYAAVSLLRLAKYGDESSAAKASRKTAIVASRFALFLLAFMITWVWGLAHRVYNLIDPNPVYIMVALHTFFTPFQGFLNMMAYGVIFQAKVIWFCKTKLCCRKDEESA